MVIRNPALIEAPHYITDPTPKEFNTATDKVLPVSRMDYPKMWKCLIVLNSLAWIAHILGWIE